MIAEAREVDWDETCHRGKESLNSSEDPYIMTTNNFQSYFKDNYRKIKTDNKWYCVVFCFSSDT